MPDFTFPFPGLELAHEELARDSCYAKIPPEDREGIIAMAWKKGEDAARMIWQRYHGETDFFEIAKQAGLDCQRVDKDYVMGNQRYFSDYLSGENSIRLFTKSIRLWAEQNSLTQQQAENLILSHEFFHFLECTELGITSRQYQVPMLVAGPIKLGKTGIRALSEIGAHAFARQYYEQASCKEEPGYV